LKINTLLYFLQSYIYFDNQENSRKFELELDTITAENKSMGIKELATLLIKESGREEGREEARSEARTALVTNLLLKSNHTISEIADFADVTIDFVIELKNKLGSNE